MKKDDENLFRNTQDENFYLDFSSEIKFYLHTYTSFCHISSKRVLSILYVLCTQTEYILWMFIKINTSARICMQETDKCKYSMEWKRNEYVYKKSSVLFKVREYQKLAEIL